MNLIVKCYQNILENLLLELVYIVTILKRYYHYIERDCIFLIISWNYNSKSVKSW